MRHLLSLSDLTAAEIDTIFAVGRDLKAKFDEGVREPILPGRVMALLFEKPSLRTRASFQGAMTHLGGGSMYLGPEAGWGTREATKDFGRVLSEYADIIVVRCNSHDMLLELAEHCTSPVVNGLTPREHPCQVMADLFTLMELFGTFDGLRLAYVGDCNNVARSLALGCAAVGIELAVAAPEGYQFDDAFVSEVKTAYPRAKIELSADPAEAVRGAAAVYTDVWTSMGQEAESDRRRKIFAPYQVNAELMAHAPDAYFLHCLPAHRGEEVTDDVIDSPQSVVVQQAANRLHTQKGIVAWLLGTKT